MIDLQQVLSRYKTAENRRRNWENLYWEAMFYTMPERAKFYEQGLNMTEGYRQDRHLHTSLPLLYLEEFADNLSAAMTPYGGEWVTLDAQDGPGFNDEPEAIQNALVDIQMHAQAAIMESNYHTEVVQSFLDLGMGTMCLWVGKSEEPSERLRFESIPLPELMIEKGYVGIATGVFRKRQISLRQCETLFPKHDFSEHMTNAFLDEKSREDPKGQEIELIESCVEVSPMDEDSRKKGKYYYSIIDKKFEVDITGTPKFMTFNPFIIARWSVVGGEIYGRGPAVQCLGDIKQLNKLIEFVFRATFRNIAPPVLAADDGILNPNTAVLSPDSVIAVRSTNPASSYGIPQVLQTSGSFELSLINQDELKSRIGDHFLVEQFGDMNNPSKSPEEVYVRHQRFQRRVGAKYPRLVNEFMKPLVRNVLELLDIPKETMEPLGERKAIYAVPRSPAEQQRRATAMQRFLATLAALHPSAVLAAIKPSKMITALAEAEGVPLEVLQSEKQIEASLQKAMEAMQQAAAQQKVEQGGGAQQSPTQQPPQAT